MELGTEILGKELEKGGENPYKSKFESFFELAYKKEVEKLAAHYPEKKSLNIDFRELEKFDFELADDLLTNPDYLMAAAVAAIESVDIPALEIERFKPHIRFHSLPEDGRPLLRDISSEHLGKLISIEGVIRAITGVMPKLQVAVWQCRRCGNTYKTPQDGRQIKMPAFCECRHRDFALAEDQSEFIDYQKIQIQEPLEQLRGNEQPSCIDVHISNDLVNRVNAGDKVKFTGILRLADQQSQGKKITYGRILEGIHIEETEREFERVEISKEEEEEIRKLAAHPEIYEMLIQSLAPEIYGHEILKEAIILQLFGGVKKTLPHETVIRGNIHVLLVGDPGAGKSMLLTATDKIAPKSIYVAGKTTTGAGITATAVKDEFGDGGWTLKAGAMVLASGGVIMIDEFEKMDPEDRGALHEALEQQRISVAKAGIVTTFKTETSVLAAANPKFSRFDPYEPIMNQVDLPPTLISRFDLFFMIKDVLDRTKDTKIADHILKSHHAGELIQQMKKKGKSLKSITEFEALEKRITPLIDRETLQKYISFARQNVFPTLSSEAIKLISDFYVNLREEGKEEGTYMATHRQLEGLVRLSEASARVRLSDVVEIKDAERATRLLKQSLEAVVIDPETGKIDIDILTSGRTHTQTETLREELKKVMAIIREKAEELDMVPIADVIEEAKKEGMGKERIFEIIGNLRKSGEIYDPKHGFLKPIKK